MKHLKRDGNYTVVRKALAEDSPHVAVAMDRMSDSVSAATEIITNQLGVGSAYNLNLILPLATEIFKEASLAAREVREDHKEEE